MATLAEKRAARRMQRIKRFAERHGVKIPDPEPPTPEEYPKIEPIEVEKEEAPWYAKPVQAAGKALAGFGEFMDKYIINPYVGAMASVGYALPGELRGEDKWRQKTGEAKGPWDFLQKSAESIDEEFPWWVKELAAATNPLMWVGPSEALGITGRIAGLAGKGLTRMDATGAAAAAMSTAEGLGKAAQTVRSWELAIMKPALYPLEKIMQTPVMHRGRLNLAKAIQEVSVRHPNWYTKNAQKDRAGWFATDILKILHHTPMKGTTHTTMTANPPVSQLATKLRYFMDGDPRATEALDWMIKEYPETAKFVTETLWDTQNHFMKLGATTGGKGSKATIDWIESLARESGDDLQAFMHNFRLDVMVANEYKTGARKMELVVTPAGQRASIKRPGELFGKKITKGNLLNRPLGEINEMMDRGLVRWSPVKEAPNLWYRVNQKIKSKFMYPLLLAGRPQWFVNNTAYNFAIPAYQMGLGYRHGISTAGRKGRALEVMESWYGPATGKGVVRQEAGDIGFGISSEARDLAQTNIDFIATEERMPLNFWETTPGLEQTLGRVQRWSAKSEKAGHRVLYDAKFLEGLPDEKAFFIDDAIKKEIITPEQGARLRGCSTKQEVDAVLGRWDDQPILDIFPTDHLEPSTAAIFHNMKAEGKFDFVKTVDDLPEMQRLLDDEVRLANRRSEDQIVLMMGNDVDVDANYIVAHGDEAREVYIRELQDQVPEIRAKPGFEQEHYNELTRLDKDFQAAKMRMAGVGPDDVEDAARFDDLNRAIARKYRIPLDRAEREYTESLAKISASGRPQPERIRAARDKYYATRKKLGKQWREEKENLIKKANEYADGLAPVAEIAQRLSDDAISASLREVGCEWLDPRHNPQWKEIMAKNLEKKLANIDQVMHNAKQIGFHAAPGAPNREAVYEIFAKALSSAQMKASTTTNRTLFNYGNRTMLDFWAEHVMPFPFFQFRHLMSMGCMALERPQQVAFFAQVLNKAFEAHSDRSAFSRLAWQTPIKLPDGTQVLLRPHSMIQPMEGGILQLLALGKDEETARTAKETVDIMAKFVGDFIYPQVELATGAACPDLTASRYFNIRSPEEVMKGLIPQWTIGEYMFSNNGTFAKTMIENQTLLMNQQQYTAVAYYIGEMMNNGEITEEVGKEALFNLKNGKSDDINVKAAQRALGFSRGSWLKLVQFHGLPVTLRTPGWQTMEMIRRRTQEGMPPGKERLLAPHEFDEMREQYPSLNVSKFVMPKELPFNERQTWSDTVDYWYKLDQASQARQLNQLEIDKMWKEGQIDGSAYVALRQQNYHAWNGMVQDAEGTYKNALKDRDEMEAFNRKIGRQVSPVHPYQEYVQGYFDIELNEGWPPDYEQLRRDREQYLNNLTTMVGPDAAEYVRKYAGKNLTTVEREYKDAVRIMTPYWNIERIVMEKRGLYNIWKEVRGNRQYEYYVRKTNRQYRAAMREVSQLRKMIRRSDPALEQAFLKFWGMAPVGRGVSPYAMYEPEAT